MSSNEQFYRKVGFGGEIVEITISGNKVTLGVAGKGHVSLSSGEALYLVRYVNEALNRVSTEPASEPQLFLRSHCPLKHETNRVCPGCGLFSRSPLAVGRCLCYVDGSDAICPLHG